MDPPQPLPPFPPFPVAGVIPATVQNAAPTISTAQIITEPSQNHIAHVANPTPQVTHVSNHPPYADMIYAAITALKERDGSSKRAIAKYIEKAYTGLPPTHSALLTHHLKRLKNTGLLEMVKKSYKLPRSDSTNDTINNNNNNNNTTTTTQPHPVAVSAAPSPPGPKRGRGRPPKPKPNSHSEPIASQHNNEHSQPVMVPVGLSFTTQPNVTPANSLLAQSVIPPPPAADNNINNVNLNANANNQVQMVVKRGPGRPKKAAGQGGGAAVVVAAGGKRRGRPPKSGGLGLGVKKSPGRPRKPKSVGANGVKKVLPKRLPKSVVVPYATGGAVVNVARPRGRPKKDAVLAAPGGAVMVPAKSPGRPPKVAGVVGRPKKRGARPVGRPKKNTWAATESSQLQAEAYGDLKRKFEYLQSRVKHAVNVLKPTLTTESAVHAVAELENLASMGINVQMREEALQPQPQPQPQPQQLPVPPQPAVIQS